MFKKVSIIMSAYNASKTIVESIESILSQTYKHFELIIVNDGSTDSTPQIIRQYALNDYKIKIIDKKTNDGLTKSLNIGLKKTTGDYIARIDADDIWHKNKLERQINFLEKNREYVLLGTAYNEIDKNGNILFSIQRMPILTSDLEIRKNIIKFNPFCHSSIVMRKFVIKDIGFYNEAFEYSQDYEFWIRIMNKYKVANLTDILTSRRLTKDMISIKKGQKQKMYAIKAKLLAIKLFNKSFFSYKFLITDLLIFYLPPFITKTIRRIKWKYNRLMVDKI